MCYHTAQTRASTPRASQTPPCWSQGDPWLCSGSSSCTLTTSPLLLESGMSDSSQCTDTATDFQTQSQPSQGQVQDLVIPLSRREKKISKRGVLSPRHFEPRGHKANLSALPRSCWMRSPAAKQYFFFSLIDLHIVKVGSEKKSKGKAILP